MSNSREELANNLNIQRINHEENLVINFIEDNFNQLMDVKPPHKINEIII